MSHGFYRLFVWEAVLALVVLNGPRWFLDPFCPRQIVSWLLLLLSIYPLVAGVLLLRRRGRPAPVGPESSNYAFENTQSLVTTGVFRYIRHPMYSSLLLLAWGTLLKGVTPLTLVLALLATAALYATARVEEAEDLARFGPAYGDYMALTRRFIPFVF